jgi:DNA topoisomerase-2
MSEQIQKLTHVEHILKRSGMYIGGLSPVTETFHRLDGSTDTLTFSPGLLKIFDEVLVNALDRNANFPSLVKKISMKYDVHHARGPVRLAKLRSLST